MSKEEDIIMENITDKNKKCIKCNEIYASSCAKIVSEEENMEMENIRAKSKKCKNIIDGEQCKIQVFNK